MRIISIACLLIFAFGCDRERTNKPGTIGAVLGLVDSRLYEASGLVASINNRGFLWTINDSGNPPEVFLIDRHARIRMVCKLTNIQNRDWEDITIGTEPNGKNYLYVADIGDNFSQYEYKIIYRFEEPTLSTGKDTAITRFDTFVMRMPGGNRDAETILMDPATQDLFIVSKQDDSASVFLIPRPFLKSITTLKKVLTIPCHDIVAGSISADGREVLLKNYNNIFYWKRKGNESIPQLLATPPIELPYQREPQGEAIAWSRDGNEFYTLSESTWRERASLIVTKRSVGLAKDSSLVLSKAIQ